MEAIKKTIIYTNFTSKDVEDLRNNLDKVDGEGFVIESFVAHHGRLSESENREMTVVYVKQYPEVCG